MAIVRSQRQSARLDNCGAPANRIDALPGPRLGPLGLAEPGSTAFLRPSGTCPPAPILAGFLERSVTAERSRQRAARGGARGARVAEDGNTTNEGSASRMPKARITRSYWCASEASAVVLTERPKRLGWLPWRGGGNLRLHRATDWVTADAPRDRRTAPQRRHPRDQDRPRSPPGSATNRTGMDLQ